MMRPTPRPIHRLLVANRGEIASRVLSSARELDIETFAVYTSNDVSHTWGAAHAIELFSPAAYLDIDKLITLANRHDIDAVHPGYGFLSESADFARRMWEAGVTVVGPGWDILDRTGDKLKARQLAAECEFFIFTGYGPERTHPCGPSSSAFCRWCPSSPSATNAGR